MNKTLVSLNVNGRTSDVAITPNRTLATVIREELNLTGTKVGCDMGTCGCCTVLVDGRPALSCLTLAAECQGAHIETIESLSNNNEKLHPLQRAWAECGGSQCGFCTPGFIMTSKYLIAHNPSPSREQICEAIGGNLCRCTGFVKIVDSIERAAAEMRGEELEAVPDPVAVEMRV